MSLIIRCRGNKVACCQTQGELLAKFCRTENALCKLVDEGACLEYAGVVFFVIKWNKRLIRFDNGSSLPFLHFVY